MGEHVREATELEKLTRMTVPPNPYLPSFADASAEVNHWSAWAGASDAVTDAWCQLYHGMSLPSFADASAEVDHGSAGANDAVTEAWCQLYHGMSLAEYEALPDDMDEQD